MPIIQEAIHKLEVAAGGRKWLKVTLAVLAICGFAVLYNFRSFRNMSAPEAMDMAQVARNLSEGKGYTTSFVRPFSMYLLKQHNQPVPTLGGERLSEVTRIKEQHPDLANPPLYPACLAVLMKVLPFHYAMPTKPQRFFTNGSSFWRHQPDFIIAVFNQALFVALIVMSFFLARRLFDNLTGWISAAFLFGADILWKFSVSGLSTMLLLVLFMALVWCLVLLEEEVREARYGLVAALVLSLFAGLLLGLGGLTRYAYGFMVFPVVGFLLIFGGPRRWVMAAIAVFVFLLVFTPWTIRNFHLSGTPFGTATYTAFQSTPYFQGPTLERSLEPDLSRGMMTVVTEKLLGNLKFVLQNDLPHLGGNWVGAFFLVGLLVNFVQVGTLRIRNFLLLCLGVFILIQSLGRTWLSEATPDVNSENLLILFFPLVLMYGVSFFFLLLNQIYLPLRELRYVVIGLFCLIACFPLAFTFLPPKTYPIVYPPYFPPSIQSTANYLKPGEMMMSDIPWATAWYGRAQSLWMPLSLQSTLEINDYQKPIQALYLSQGTMDKGLLSYWLSASEEGWAGLILQTPSAMATSQDPATTWPKYVNLSVRRGDQQEPFFLHYLHLGWPQQLILTSRSQTTIKAE
jgi:4-amino-4-deoxy-L-arabinose transferase-like glycosyltransferase